MVYEARVARTHSAENPLDYGSYVAYRDLAELQRIVDQLPGLTVTMHHPDGLVAEGASADVIGVVKSARIQDEHAVVEMVVYDAAGISAIEDGTRELSLGYQCNMDALHYQRDIKLDHLAVVDAARCGPTCALRADAVGCGCQVVPAPKPEPAAACPCKSHAVSYAPAIDMPDPVNDELKTQLTAALSDAAAQRVRADAADTRATAAEIVAENATRELDNLNKTHLAAVAAEKTRADEAVAARDAAITKADADVAAMKVEHARDIDAKVADAAKLRAELVRTAEAADLDAEEMAKLDNKAIKLATIAKIDGKALNADGKSDDFIDGIYVRAAAGLGAASVADALKVIADQRAAATLDHTKVETPKIVTLGTEDDANKKMTDRLTSGWTK